MSGPLDSVRYDAGEVAPVLVPGPVDREDFWDAETRHRRASWRFTALAALATFAMGVPMSAIVSPFVYAVAFFMLDVVNLVVPTPDLLARRASTTASASSTTVPAWGVAVGLAVLLLPGAIALLLCWLSVRALFRQAGAGAVVLALGGREPRPGELEEHQLENVVAEMAAACGVPPPPIRVLDSPIANACAVGSSLEDATVVVTTGLLSALGRDETQAVMGVVMGSVGNGDLRIGTTILSLFETLGVAETFLAAPADPLARRRLWRLLKFAVSAQHRRQTDEAAAIAELMAKAEEEGDSQDDRTTIGRVLALPFYAASGALKLTGWVFIGIFVNPLLRWAWRARCYLADASAVQLTRNPQAVGHALSTLGLRARETGAVVVGAEWAGHFFVVGGTAASGDPPVVGYHPKLEKRIERLNRLGAMTALPTRPTSYGIGGKIFIGLAFFILGPVLLACAGALLFCALMICMLVLMMEMLVLGIVLGPLHAILRNAAG